MNNWGAFLVHRLLHPLTIIATPIICVCLCGYFVLRNFQLDIYLGIRSLGGFLLPLLVVNYIYFFRRNFLSSIKNLNVVVGFLLALVWGFVAFGIIHFFSTVIHHPVPIPELVLSASFSILVFSFIGEDEYLAKVLTDRASVTQAPQMLMYYYGLVVGFTAYIVIVGFPIPSFGTPGIQ